MGSEFDGIDDEPKDRTRAVWAGIVVVVAVLCAALWHSGRPDPKVSVVHARHILITFDQSDPTGRAQALETANELRQRILDGESFEETAREYSNDPDSAKRGGDLGVIKKGEFADNFEEYVWKAPLNELSDIVVTPHGFHLIKVVYRHVSKSDRYEQELAEKARKKLREERGAAADTATPVTQN
jgi:parvulin-like peptidyl-prolyl isomerase